MNNDPLTAHEVQPTKTVSELVHADERLKKEFPLIQLFYDTAGSTDKTLKLYEGHVHDLLNDIGKEKVMADIKTWIDKHLPAA